MLQSGVKSPMLAVVMAVCGSEQYVARFARHSFEGCALEAWTLFLMALVWLGTPESRQSWASDLFQSGCATP